MKIKRSFALCLATTLCMLALSACGKAQTPQLANELQFSLSKITSLTISYDEENINFYKSKDNTLIIKEYMTENKRNYYANVSESSDSIKINEGDKPLFEAGFTRYIEVYLPTSYNQNLTVTSTSGNINLLNITLKLGVLRIGNTSGTVTINNALASEVYLSSTSGTIKTGDIQANTIRLETTSGSITCKKLNGTVQYISTSGDLDVESAIGAGSYRVNNSGKLRVAYSEVNGDLSFYNKNDNITLMLPKKLQFSFEAITKNGSVITNFQESLTTNEHTTSGDIGNSPTVTVTVETNDGDIEVMQ